MFHPAEYRQGSSSSYIEHPKNAYRFAGKVNYLDGNETKQ